MKEIWFIRHGESLSNAGLPTEHPAKTPLTEQGHRQARILPPIFDRPPDLFVVSPYQRTRQTAEPTLLRFPHVPVAEWPVQEYTFLDPIHWKSTTGRDRHPAITAYWERADPFYCDGNGAESFAGVLQRVDATFELIRKQENASFIVIFSHGHFIRLLMWVLLMPRMEITPDFMSRSLKFVRGLSFPNCAILKLRLEHNRFWMLGIEQPVASPDLGDF
jgi:broad specificity phosphatase PhoE